MTPWLGRPTSYASGYISAQCTAAPSQSLTVLLSSPPMYWTGLDTRGRSNSSAGKTDSTLTPHQGRPVRQDGVRGVSCGRGQRDRLTAGRLVARPAGSGRATRLRAGGGTALR